MYRNVSLNGCNETLASSDCLNALNSQLGFYVQLLMAIFYSTATVNLFLKIISLFNFKYWLMHRLVFKTKSKEDELYSQYNDSKSRLFRRRLESQIAENEKYWVENFQMDLNLRNEKQLSDGDLKMSGGDQTAAVENRYLNVEAEHFLDEDEKLAIEMIDDAINKPSLNQQENEKNKYNTFKAKK